MDRQVAALADVFYQPELTEYGDNPGDPDGWENVLDALDGRIEAIGPDGNPEDREWRVELPTS